MAPKKALLVFGIVGLLIVLSMGGITFMMLSKEEIPTSSPYPIEAPPDIAN